MQQTTPDLDPLSVAITVLAILVGPAIAPYAAAYSIIIFGAVVGMFIGLLSRNPSGRLSAIGYIIVTGSASLFMTVPASNYLTNNFEVFKNGSSWLLFPISFGITAYGELWLRYFKSGILLLLKNALGSKE